MVRQFISKIKQEKPEKRLNKHTYINILTCTCTYHQKESDINIVIYCTFASIGLLVAETSWNSRLDQQRNNVSHDKTYQHIENMLIRESNELWWVGKRINNKSDIGAAQSEIVFYNSIHVNPSSDWTSPTSLFSASQTPSSIIFSYIRSKKLNCKFASKHRRKVDIWYKYR